LRRVANRRIFAIVTDGYEGNAVGQNWGSAPLIPDGMMATRIP
jgi:hypothetical protein